MQMFLDIEQQQLRPKDIDLLLLKVNYTYIVYIHWATVTKASRHVNIKTKVVCNKRSLTLAHCRPSLIF